MGPIKSFTLRKMCKEIMDLIKDSKIPLTALQVKNGNRKLFVHCKGCPINLSMLFSFYCVIIK